MPPLPKASYQTAINVLRKFDSFKESVVAPKLEESLVDGLPNLKEGDMLHAREDSRCHYRFAGGRILPKPALCAIFSMACKLFAHNYGSEFRSHSKLTSSSFFSLNQSTHPAFSSSSKR